MNSDHPNGFLKIKSKRDKFEYFSKGILSSKLTSIGMNANLALDVANHVESEVSSDSEPISKKRLIKVITTEVEKIDKRLAERYKVYEGDEKYKPIIILLAGVPGIGKSTLSSRLSQKLEISNIIGTDMIRQILRQTISSKLVPELHCSSYEAYKFLKQKLNPTLRQSIVGYEEQSRHVVVGVEASIQSALYSRENTIIEGVHLAPNIIKPSVLNEPHVLMMLLYLEDEDEHLSRIKARGTAIKKRRADKYIEAFQEIRSIQTYLVEEATKANIKMIETTDSKEALEKLMDYSWEKILKLEASIKG